MLFKPIWPYATITSRSPTSYIAPVPPSLAPEPSLVLLFSTLLLMDRVWEAHVTSKSCSLGRPIGQRKSARETQAVVTI